MEVFFIVLSGRKYAKAHLIQRERRNENSTKLFNLYSLELVKIGI